MKNREFNKQTSVRVNAAKYDLIKIKGYNIQDILDDAFNIILELENDIPEELLVKKEEIENQLVKTLKLREIAINENEKKLKEAQYKYKAELKQIEKEREAINKFNHELNCLKIEQASINKLIHNAAEDTRALTEIQEDDFKKLVKIFKDNFTDEKDPEYITAVNDYCSKYNINDPAEVKNKVLRSFNDLFNEI